MNQTVCPATEGGRTAQQTGEHDQINAKRAAYLALSPLLGLKPDAVNESPEAHQFAQGVGGAFLLAAALALLSGLTGLGVVLGFLVIGLALLNLTARICVGCLMYFQYKMLRHRLTAKA